MTIDKSKLPSLVWLQAVNANAINSAIACSKPLPLVPSTHPDGLILPREATLVFPAPWSHSPLH